MTVSRHLTEIMENRNRITNMQIAFVDIEKYSQRRTLTQIQTIDSLTECFKIALTLTSQSYIDYVQTNSINFQTDIIKLPTGDGAAIVFTFDGLHDIHLEFAKKVLSAVYDRNQRFPCEKFDAEGWCNCHSNFNVRIGISEGKGIIFKDMNSGFNVAGGAINMASRMMNFADKNQIIFTEDAYRQIVDMIENPSLVNSFIKYSDVTIKHNHKISVYQFKDDTLSYLNNKLP